MVRNLTAVQETWVRKIPWRRERLPARVSLPGEFLHIQVLMSIKGGSGCEVFAHHYSQHQDSINVSYPAIVFILFHYCMCDKLILTSSANRQIKCDALPKQL